MFFFVQFSARQGSMLGTRHRINQCEFSAESAPKLLVGESSSKYQTLVQKNFCTTDGSEVFNRIA
jgi:hypothetical protein